MIITTQTSNHIKRGNRYYQHYQIDIKVSKGKQNRKRNCNRFCNGIHITITTIEYTSGILHDFRQMLSIIALKSIRIQPNIRDMMEIDIIHACSFDLMNQLY